MTGGQRLTIAVNTLAMALAVGVFLAVRTGSSLVLALTSLTINGGICAWVLTWNTKWEPIQRCLSARRKKAM